MKPNTKLALEWIVEIFQRHSVPFQISGGCAAKIYGSPRELNDIDIDIPRDCFERILKDVSPYLTYGPAFFENEKWRLYLMTLNYEGQEIDIGEENACVSSVNGKNWISLNTDFSKVEKRMFLGIEVPVMPREKLLEYKRHLCDEFGGISQRTDVKWLQKCSFIHIT